MQSGPVGQKSSSKLKWFWPSHAYCEMSHLLLVLPKRGVRELDRGHFPATASRSFWVDFSVHLGLFAFSVGQTLIMHSCVHYMTHVIKYYTNTVYKHRVLGCMR